MSTMESFVTYINDVKSRKQKDICIDAMRCIAFARKPSLQHSSLLQCIQCYRSVNRTHVCLSAMGHSMLLHICDVEIQFPQQQNLEQRPTVMAKRKRKFIGGWTQTNEQYINARWICICIKDHAVCSEHFRMNDAHTDNENRSLDSFFNGKKKIQMQTHETVRMMFIVRQRKHEARFDSEWSNSIRVSVPYTRTYVCERIHFITQPCFLLWQST